MHYGELCLFLLISDGFFRENLQDRSRFACGQTRALPFNPLRVGSHGISEASINGQLPCSNDAVLASVAVLENLDFSIIHRYDIAKFCSVSILVHLLLFTNEKPGFRYV